MQCELQLFSPQAREGRKLDLTFARNRNANISENWKINDKINPQVVVNVPVCANVSSQAQQHIMGHVHFDI